MNAETKLDRVSRCLDILLRAEISDERHVLSVFISILQERYKGQKLYNDLEEIRIEIEKCQMSTGVPLRYELIRPWKFDLRKIVESFIPSLRNQKKGIIGFGIPYNRSNFFEYLGRRLDDEWRPFSFNSPGYPLTIDPIEMPVDMAISIIVTYAEDILRYEDLLFKVSLASDDIIPFWQKLQYCLKEQEFNHRLVVIMATNSDTDWPEGIVPLPPPQCDQFDIHTWIRDIGESLKLQAHLIESLSCWLENKCRCGEQFNSQLAYIHIGIMHNKLKQNPTVTCFHDLLNT